MKSGDYFAGHGGNVPHARSRRVAADRARRPSAPYGWYWAVDALAEFSGCVHLAHPLG